MAELESEDIEMLKGVYLYFVYRCVVIFTVSTTVGVNPVKRDNILLKLVKYRFSYWSCSASAELGSLTTANLMEKVKGLQNLAYQLGLEECKYTSNTHTHTHRQRL